MKFIHALITSQSMSKCGRGALSEISNLLRGPDPARTRLAVSVRSGGEAASTGHGSVSGRFPAGKRDAASAIRLSEST